MSGALKLSWPVRTRAELQLRTYCDRRVPRRAVRQVRMEFEIRGLSAMIVERRVPWRPTSPDEEWTRLPIAKFRFDLESTCRGPSSLRSRSRPGGHFAPSRSRLAIRHLGDTPLVQLPRRALSRRTPTSRCRSAAAGRRVRARESPPGV